jgi:hypothetical protein
LGIGFIVVKRIVDTTMEQSKYWILRLEKEQQCRLVLKKVV